MNAEIAPLLKRIKAQVPDLRLVILFGSFACSRQRQDSDIDLAFAATRPFEGRALFDLKLDMQNSGFRGVDLVDLAAADVSLILKHDIITTGLTIFEANDSVRSEFEAQIFRDYQDFIYRRRDIEVALTLRLAAYAHE